MKSNLRFLFTAGVVSFSASALSDETCWELFSRHGIEPSSRACMPSCVTVPKNMGNYYCSRHCDEYCSSCPKTEGLRRYEDFTQNDPGRTKEFNGEQNEQLSSFSNLMRFAFDSSLPQVHPATSYGYLAYQVVPSISQIISGQTTDGALGLLRFFNPFMPDRHFKIIEDGLNAMHGNWDKLESASRVEEERARNEAQRSESLSNCAPGTSRLPAFR